VPTVTGGYPNVMLVPATWAAPPPKKQTAMPVLLTVLVIAVVALVGGAIWASATGYFDKTASQASGDDTGPAAPSDDPSDDPATVVNPTDYDRDTCDVAPSAKVTRYQPTSNGATVDLTLTSYCDPNGEGDIITDALWVQVVDDYGPLGTARTNVAAGTVLPASGLSIQVTLSGTHLPTTALLLSSYAALTVEGASPPAMDDDDLYLGALSRQAAQDTTYTQSTLMERWVPQLSSKYVGLRLDNTTWDAKAIWESFRTYQNSYPTAVLLNSRQWTNFKDDGHTYWVVLVGGGASTSSDTVLSWCDAEHWGFDDCYAKYMSNTFMEHTAEYRK